MATAFSGSLGWSGLHPVQLGGPPLVHSWSRPLPQGATPVLAHAYQNDSVSALGTFPILNRPNLKATLANGGYEQITLELGTGAVGTLYGLAVYGSSVYGGTTINLTQGNVIRLTEVNNPVSGVKAPYAGFVYGGVIESFPDTLSPTGTKHEIVVSPFGWELTRVATQLVYTTPTDIIQTVRDAVALTQHCSCDQISVPTTTGVLIATQGAVDYRGQKVNQVLDTARSILGPNWFWYCDELGRVWFQYQGAAAVYTFTGGVHYTERVSNGGDIQDRVNQVPAVGGVPTGGSANVAAVANGTSQATIGVRTLDPPIQVPGITDQPTLTAIAQGILGALDVTWTRAQLKGLPPLGIPNEVHPGRVHGSQPGGAMMRLWEPSRYPLPESQGGSNYQGPFIVQTVDYDGELQTIEAGNVPVTNQQDIDNMVKSWANRATSIALINTAASLNLNQTLTGSFQSGTGTVAANGQRATLWSLGQQEFEAIDPNGIVRAEMGNLPANGNSPAQWGLRASDASGNPIFDSLGLLSGGVGKLLGSAVNFSQASVTGNGSWQIVSGSTVNFTPTRPVNILVLGAATILDPTVGDTGFNLEGQILFDGASNTAVAPIYSPGTSSFTVTLFAVATGVSAAAHSFALGVNQTNTHLWSVVGGYVFVFQFGN